MEQRKTKRFAMQLPLEIMRAGASPICRSAQIRNISSGGILFTCETEMDVGGSIEYVVTLANGTGTAVNLRCMGKVQTGEAPLRY